MKKDRKIIGGKVVDYYKDDHKNEDNDVDDRSFTDIITELYGFCKKSIWVYTLVFAFSGWLINYILELFNIQFRPIVYKTSGVIIWTGIFVGWIQVLIVLKKKIRFLLLSLIVAIIVFQTPVNPLMLAADSLFFDSSLFRQSHILEIAPKTYYVDDYGHRVEFHEYKCFLIQSVVMYEEYYYPELSPYSAYPVIYY